MRRWMIVLGVVAGLAFALPAPAGAGERTVTLAMRGVKSTPVSSPCTYYSCVYTETGKALGGDDGSVPRRWSYSGETHSQRSLLDGTFAFTARDGDTLVGTKHNPGGGNNTYYQVTGGTGSYAGCTSPPTVFVGAEYYLEGQSLPILRFELTC